MRVLPGGLAPITSTQCRARTKASSGRTHRAYPSWHLALLLRESDPLLPSEARLHLRGHLHFCEPIRFRHFSRRNPPRGLRLHLIAMLAGACGAAAGRISRSCCRSLLPFCFMSRRARSARRAAAAVPPLRAAGGQKTARRPRAAHQKTQRARSSKKKAEMPSTGNGA